MGILDRLKSVIKDKAKKVYASETTVYNPATAPGINIYLGTSTGYLLSKNRKYKNGLLGGQDVYLSSNDDSLYAGGLLALGGVGAGKTSAMIRPILAQVVNYTDVGLMIFDVKADFYEDVRMACQRFAEYNPGYHRNYYEIGVEDDCWGINLLEGLSPTMAASFLENTFYLCGGGGGDSFWIQSAVAVIEHSLGVLKFCGDEFYNLHTLYQYIFVDDVRKQLNDYVVEKVENGNYDKLSLEYRTLQADLSYYNNVFLIQDTKLQSSIKASISTIISGFCNPVYVDKFSSTDKTKNYDMRGILNGDICVLRLPLAEHGNVAKVIYTMIKLKFFNLLQQRQYNKNLGICPCGMIADEYQSIISCATGSGLSDISFWDKSRSAKCFGIISTQSITAFEAAVGGNRALVDTVLSNFRNKIIFRTEDVRTIEYCKSITGRTLEQRSSFSASEGSSGQFFGFTNKTYNNNSSYSYSVAEQDVVDANLIRMLDGNHVLALLNIGHRGVDDVLEVHPIYSL